MWVTLHKAINKTNEYKVLSLQKDSIKDKYWDELYNVEDYWLYIGL